MSREPNYSAACYHGDLDPPDDPKPVIELDMDEPDELTAEEQDACADGAWADRLRDL